MPKTSTITVRPKGKPSARSRANSSSSSPATPMEPKHNHFSMKIPFTPTMILAPGEGKRPCWRSTTKEGKTDGTIVGEVTQAGSGGEKGKKRPQRRQGRQHRPDEKRACSSSLSFGLSKN